MPSLLERSYTRTNMAAMGRGAFVYSQCDVTSSVLAISHWWINLETSSYQSEEPKDIFSLLKEYSLPLQTNIVFIESKKLVL